MRAPSAHARMKLQKQRIRVLGYDDGYAGRPARYTLVIYQRAWRLGVQARERDGNEAA